jgi:hypothetical protein
VGHQDEKETIHQIREQRTQAQIAVSQFLHQPSQFLHTGAELNCADQHFEAYINKSVWNWGKLYKKYRSCLDRQKVLLSELGYDSARVMDNPAEQHRILDRADEMYLKETVLAESIQEIK